MATLIQAPGPGERRVRFVGDTLRFSLRRADGRGWPRGWRAFLRTNLGRGAARRAEIIASVENRRPPTLASWRDIPLRPFGDVWELEVPLAEVGYFRAKAYAVDERGWQHWPDGPDVGLNVQPAFCRTANLIYCAFPRLFGPTKTAVSTHDPVLEAELQALDARDYAVIPPSGKLRDLIAELPHIFETLGCKILHLLPVNPTPTTYARFGRFGSPYACGDLLAIDPALVQFDRRTTGVDQFRELSDAVHQHGGRLFLDMVANHTGWGSTLQEDHPEWFLRGDGGRFVSPGAWGNTWEDLVELEHDHPQLRQHLGAAFLEWCRRGVDGFRCDAGYMVPLPVWQYITARVRQEFPDTIFLLEGLGGAWEATASLLTEGGLQWAYSELFQNYDRAQVAGYLERAWQHSAEAGLLVHYSETHDNDRLAARGRAWSLLRNRLCALTSVSGAFGFTCGVEWLAPEKINVHASRGLAWGQPGNLVAELARLNHLLADHPCFFDGAQLTCLGDDAASVGAWLRVSADARDAVLVLVNHDLQQAGTIRLPEAALAPAHLFGTALVDLLGQSPPDMVRDGDRLVLAVPAGGAFCLAQTERPNGVAGETYRCQKAREALALVVLSHHLPVERLGQVDWSALGEWLSEDPAGFLAAAAGQADETAGENVPSALRSAATGFPRVITWRLGDQRRVVPIPEGHWLLVQDDTPFRATLNVSDAAHPQHAVSVVVADGHIACFAPRAGTADAELHLDRYAATDRSVTGALRFLAADPCPGTPSLDPHSATGVLLTNGRGGMARLAVDLGAIRSKYDCLLAANLHPCVPVDRHVFAKRARVWVNADGFISPLAADNLADFRPGPPAQWRFHAHAGDGRCVELHLEVAMIPGHNTTRLRFRRCVAGASGGRELPPEADVRLTVRVDLEDRNFHWETQRNSGAEHHFATHCHPLPATAERRRANAVDTRGAALAGDAAPAGADEFVGFVFTPAADRQLRVWADAGRYHPQPEWCEAIAHPVEQSRGQTARGDAYSPGWFELPLLAGATVDLILCADPQDPTPTELTGPPLGAAGSDEPPGLEPLDRQLAKAARAFVVRRDEAETVIAGYPWFLDWGRDTLICARGLLAAGMVSTVKRLLQVFGRFEQEGTLPNTIHGEDASNRDTSDAPLWYGLVCEELAGQPAAEPDLLRTLRVDAAGRTLADVLLSIARGYLRGTPNGIRVDPASALVWSPSHFTWMDTNHPAGTPREGYPIEIQALWVRLLRQLDRLGSPVVAEPWGQLADQAWDSIERLFWLEDRGYYADVLLAPRGQTAAAATAQDALRSNCLQVVALGLATGERAQRCVESVRRHLVVPGALRSLAPLPVSPPLPIHAADGRLLNDPQHPYWGRYEGDEDTRRKPAYHNGTAWTWTFPGFCEALARAYDDSPPAVAAAWAYLGGIDRLLAAGCVGHLPEILDGDAPHAQRGCDAQAWSVTEALRVGRLLQAASAPGGPAGSK